MNQPFTPVEDTSGHLVRGHASQIEAERPAATGKPALSSSTLVTARRVLELETFTTLEKGSFGHMIRNEPHVWNQVVNVNRYRIIVEEIPEPENVIRERLIRLWQTTNNIHHLGPLREMAKRFGIELPKR